MSVAISARGLVKGYHDGLRWLEVLRGVDLEIEAGELVAIVGPSGSGKSTLLHLLGALDRPTGGRLEIGGVDPATLSRGQAAAFRNRTLGFVFQFHQLLPDFTALENVMMPGRIARRDPSETLKRARALLEEVGLGDRLDHTPGQLSGGECQRVALCRALALEPPLLLADEPTGNLDPDNGRAVFDLLLDLVQRRGSTAVVVTHNPELAGRCARLFALDHGVLRGASKA
ncbi:MAG TPA: ABC transporter ATP-binding protein [Thermoanaerobaculia bacterium]|nr:ABC transporter ATP-binding protein [Thermoanaerobaculia bacterium]